MTTLRAVLFGELIPGQAGSIAQKVEQAAERLAGAGAVPPGLAVGPVSIARTVMNRVADLLNVEVSDVLVGAWRTRSALLHAARETLANPGTHQQVMIKTYAFPWDYEIDVDVMLDASTIASMAFVVTVEVEITALAATVQSGCMTAVNGGDCKITATLQAKIGQASVFLAQAERRLDLRFELVLAAPGIPLVEPARP